MKMMPTFHRGTNFQVTPSKPITSLTEKARDCRAGFIPVCGRLAAVSHMAITM